ncbi:hypothetical protein LCGC14_0936410 [marine sediment metagenome]|uniref:Peptide deformylase n=1 Tax=marine sediment metagenome TaxID=412755 RepID=A0A0F9NR04_9ZZZZ
MERVRKLLVVENRLLRKKSKPVKTIDGVVREVAEFLEHQLTLERPGRKPAGFAAVQFGEPIRVIIFRRDTLTNLVLLNPEIFSEKDSVTKIEECFSIPGHGFIVTRPKMVKCRGLNLNGETVIIKGRDSLARLLKHEVDHLDGILIDKVADRRLY